jgi:uncharacterized OB-fold protein
MIPPELTTRTSATLARIESMVARLTELGEEEAHGIEANLFELSELRTRCGQCAYLYRPYLERCPTCSRRSR